LKRKGKAGEWITRVRKGQEGEWRGGPGGVDWHWTSFEKKATKSQRTMKRSVDPRLGRMGKGENKSKRQRPTSIMPRVRKAWTARSGLATKKQRS